MNNIYDLSKIRRSTKIKLVFMIFAIILPIAIVSILTSIKLNSANPVVITILRYLITICGETFIVYKLIYYIRILQSDSFAEKAIIAKNDERLIFIRQKYSTFCIKLILFILLIAVIISGFLNNIVFYTLFSTLVVVIICALASIIYYKKKY